MNIYTQLKSDGKSIAEICMITGKKKSFVYSQIDPEGREKDRIRLNNFRSKRINSYKELCGSSCIVCEYNLCPEALEFHHVYPEDKLFEISDAVYQKDKISNEQILEEIQKCILVCCRCHREIHAGLIAIEFGCGLEELNSI